MENKIFSLIAVGFFLNVITASLIANCYMGFMDSAGHLTHINKEHSVIDINGY